MPQRKSSTKPHKKKSSPKKSSSSLNKSSVVNSSSPEKAAWKDFIVGESSLSLGGKEYPINDLLCRIPGDRYLQSQWSPFKGVSPDVYYFDTDRAQFTIDFFSECLVFIEGQKAGQPFIPEPWQASILCNIFGWKRHKDNFRRFREVFLYVPRKNGKTPLCAGLALFVLFCDHEPGAICYAAAADREQANNLFRHSHFMVLECPEMLARCRPFRGEKRIHYPEGRSDFKTISSIAETKHGPSVHLSVIDELHAIDKPDLVEVLRTARGARAQPLMVFVTTADYVRESICNTTYSYAAQVRDGVIDNPAYLPIIYETPRLQADEAETNWTDLDLIRRVNPNYGISVNDEFLASELSRAKAEPSYENTFKRLYLNMQTSSSERWLRLDRWETCRWRPTIPIELPSEGHYGPIHRIPDKEVTPQSWRECLPDVDFLSNLAIEQDWKVIDDFKSNLTEEQREFLDRPWFAGIDMSSTSDLTAVVLFSPEKYTATDSYPVIPYIWLPGENADKRTREDGVPYNTWVDKGFIIPTEGDYIDPESIVRHVIGIHYFFDTLQLGFDRWGAEWLYVRLESEGVPAVRFGQGFAQMFGPCCLLERMVGDGLLNHGGNPLLKWTAGNVVIRKDADNRIRPDKKESTEKIDPIVALLMAVGLATLHDPELYQLMGLTTLSAEAEA